MSDVRRFDHVGLTVADLDVVTAFFVALGLEVEGRTFVEGEFLDTVCGIPDSRTEIVMLKPPDDGTRLELSTFVRPDPVPGAPAPMATELGLRNVAFEVNDLQAAVDWAATEGYGLVGGIGEYEGAWRMAYVRGPEGIIVSLAEAHRLSLATPSSAACSPSWPHVPAGRGASVRAIEPACAIGRPWSSGTVSPGNPHGQEPRALPCPKDARSVSVSNATSASSCTSADEETFWSDPSSARAASPALLSISPAIRASMVCAAMMRHAVTGSACPMRWLRSLAWVCSASVQDISA